MERVEVTHDKKQRLRSLNGFIRRSISDTECELSDVKRDGTIFIRFKSTDVISAIEATETFGRILSEHSIEFTQIDDVRIRMLLPETTNEIIKGN